MLYLILLRSSVSLPLYRCEKSIFPASIISLLVELSLLNFLAFFLKCSFSLSIFSGDPFPIPNRPDVVSHPAIAWIKSIFLQTMTPKASFMDKISLITVSLLKFCFMSDLKKILWLFKSAWYSNKTSRSVSSPTTIVSEVKADSMAFDTIKVSASLFAWYTIHPTD